VGLRLRGGWLLGALLLALVGWIILVALVIALLR